MGKFTKDHRVHLLTPYSVQPSEEEYDATEDGVPTNKNQNPGRTARLSEKNCRLTQEVKAANSLLTGRADQIRAAYLLMTEYRQKLEQQAQQINALTATNHSQQEKLAQKDTVIETLTANNQSQRETLAQKDTVIETLTKELSKKTAVIEFAQRAMIINAAPAPLLYTSAHAPRSPMQAGPDFIPLETVPTLSEHAKRAFR